MNAGRSAAAISCASAVHAPSSGASTTLVARIEAGHLTRRRAEDVEGEVEEDRAAMRRRGKSRRLEHHRAGHCRIGDRRGRFRDRREDRHVVELLQRSRAPTTLRRASAEHDQRGPVEPRRRHRRDAVRDPRPGGERRQPRLPGQLGVGLGGERRGLFVASVDDTHPLVASCLVERPDVAPVQREHHVGPESPQCRYGLFSGVSLDHFHGSVDGGICSGFHGVAPYSGRSLNDLCKWPSPTLSRRLARIASSGGRRRSS